MDAKEKAKFQQEAASKSADAQRARGAVLSRAPPEPKPTAGEVQLGTRVEVCWQCTTLEATRLIGEGAYGSVYECQSAAGARYAVKLYGRSAGENLDNEAAAYKRLSAHPNILALWGAVTATTDDRLGLIFELGHPLSEYLRDRRLPLQLDREPKSLAKQLRVRWQVAVQLSQGLDFMHKLEVIHCDVKVSNAIVQMDTNVVKWCDLGLASRSGTFVVANEKYTAVCRPPELGQIGDKSIRIAPSADVWAYGCTVFSVLSASPAAYLFPDRSVLYCKKFVTTRLSTAVGHDVEGQRVISQMLKQSPLERISLASFMSKGLERIRVWS
ncbi:Plk4 [Symbiodinium natans]|uniref:Plk4 protein n=1 Tax=Symbiodinium natans TaxID=878477 RepID=A0A812KBK6_9DINO|nr:Plk4 [Symbiodinium natans]